jgi:hypothetical protein
MVVVGYARRKEMGRCVYLEKNEKEKKKGSGPAGLFAEEKMRKEKEE